MNPAIAAAFSPCWYLARSGGLESRTLAELDRSGIEYYYPQTWGQERIPKRELTWNKRNAVFMRPKKIPLWKRYFFVHIDLEMSSWRDCFERASIYGILANSEGGRLLPAPIDDRLVERIRDREVDGVIPPEVRVFELLYAAGDHVSIRNGAIRQGIVHENIEKPIGGLDENAKVKIAISLLGKTCVVEVRVGDIEKL